MEGLEFHKYPNLKKSLVEPVRRFCTSQFLQYIRTYCRNSFLPRPWNGPCQTLCARTVPERGKFVGCNVTWWDLKILSFRAGLFVSCLVMLLLHSTSHHIITHVIQSEHLQYNSQHTVLYCTVLYHLQQSRHSTSRHVTGFE